MEMLFLFLLMRYLFFGFSYKGGVVDSLPVDAELNVYYSGMFFGFGPGYLKFNGDGVCKTLYFFMFAPFLLI